MQNLSRRRNSQDTGRSHAPASEAPPSDLSRRLLNAQDAERARIARELHDGIGQSLGLLNVQLQRAALRATSESEKTLIREVSNTIREIGRQVSRLSHQLRSPDLELLGLAAAMESLCREFSEQHAIKVEFDCRGLSAELDPGIAQCLLRIAQEGLDNISKHSNATAVQVRLTAHDEEITLTIEDDGRGFDVNAARTSSGVGLISMRERASLIGGALKISSAPGRGTSLQATAPLLSKRAEANTATAAKGS